MLLSVVVPIYKVESYLSVCIDSILRQSFTDFELILVDDGSPDNSGKICEDYAIKDSRVRVFHKNNGGVSSARNLGIAKAEGKFITFIDGDDFIDPNFFNELCSPCITDEDIDFVHAGCVNYYEDGSILPNQKYENHVGNDKTFIFKIFRGLVFSKLFSLERIRQHGICFDEAMKYAEDMVFTIDYLVHSNKYALVDSVGYYYVQREGSAMNSSVKYNYDRDYRSFFHRYTSVNNYIKKYNISKKDSELRYIQTSDSFYTALFSLYNSNFSFSQIYKLYKKDIKSDYYMLSRYSSSLVSRVVMYAFHYGGFYIGDFCIRILLFLLRLKNGSY